MKPPKSFNIKSNGCVLNQLDGARLQHFIENSGSKIKSKFKDADIIIINTCAYNKIKELESIDLIRSASEKKSFDGEIIVCGCLPKIDRKSLDEVFTGKIFNPNEMKDLENLLNLNPENKEFFIGRTSFNQYPPIKKIIYYIKKIIDKIPTVYKIKSFDRLLNSLFVYSDDVYCLKVESGCNGLCTYCAIKFVKGKVLSKSLMEIRSEVEQAISHGFSKFAIMGDEIGAYGYDTDDRSNLLDIIRMLYSNDSVESIYLPWIEPSFLITHYDSFILYLEKIKVIDSPVQNGSNRILNLMKREYKVEDFVYCIRGIKNQHPNILIRTDLIIGFPGETDQDFIETLNLVKKNLFDFIHVYEYEDRPKTIASKMHNKVPPEIIKYRVKKILIQQRKNYFNKKRFRFINKQLSNEQAAEQCEQLSRLALTEPTNDNRKKSPTNKTE
jgi:MiaB/RimO family radical SAM methylthiotransferase